MEVCAMPIGARAHAACTESQRALGASSHHCRQALDSGEAGHLTPLGHYPDVHGAEDFVWPAPELVEFPLLLGAPLRSWETRDSPHGVPAIERDL